MITLLLSLSLSLHSYDVLASGAPNFICVALALDDLGYHATGVRIDSGDLAYLSREVRSMLENVAKSTCRPWLSSVVCIVFLLCLAL